MLIKMNISPDMKDGRLVATLKSKLEDFWAALLQKMSIGIDEEVAIIHALEIAATGSKEATKPADEPKCRPPSCSINKI